MEPGPMSEPALRFSPLSTALALAGGVSAADLAAAGSKVKDTAYVARGVDTLYLAAKAEIDKGNSRRSAELFDGST